MGWSYGGFQTFWGVTQTRRFAAASSGAGVNDLTAFFRRPTSRLPGMLLNAAPGRIRTSTWRARRTGR